MMRSHPTWHWWPVAGVALCLEGCVSIPSQLTGPVAPLYEPAPTQSDLSKVFQAAVQRHQPASGLHLISAGIDGLLLRLELIERAQSNLDLQYYIFRSDDSGKRLQLALLRAADRGVHVRIISDDGESAPGDEKLLLLSIHPGVEVRMFNPFSYRGHNEFLRGMDFLLHKSRLDYRMHNKLMVVDGVAAIMGGRNIGDQYFQVNPSSQFADDDVFVIGPAVSRLGREFADYWNSPTVVPANRLFVHKVDEAALTRYRTELSASHPLLQKYASAFEERRADGEPLHRILADEGELTWAKVDVVYDSPEKRRLREDARLGRLMYLPIAAEIAATASSLLVVTPYLVPTPDESQLLMQQAGRNVQVRILTNSLMSTPDVLVHAGYARHRIRLLKDGVRLYEIRANIGNPRGSGETREMTHFGNYALHAKLLVFDRDAVFIGSMNLDQRSRYLNTEMGLIISGNQLADALASRFNALASPENAYQVVLDDDSPHPRLIWRTMENGEVVVYQSEPSRSAWQRFKLGFFSLLRLDREL
jgi:putative cardiolipin synthase